MTPEEKADLFQVLDVLIGIVDEVDADQTHYDFTEELVIMRATMERLKQKKTKVTHETQTFGHDCGDGFVGGDNVRYLWGGS